MEQGTSCNQRLEDISGTQHARILRVPFRNDQGVLKHWISRCSTTRTDTCLCADAEGGREACVLPGHMFSNATSTPTNSSVALNPAQPAAHLHALARFEVWPYLEQFTVDAGAEIRAELGGRPDLIIGAY